MKKKMLNQKFKTETMDLFIDNHILNPRQEDALIKNPELTKPPIVEPATGKIYFEHDFFQEPFCAGVLPKPILPLLTKIKFFVKSWRIEGRKIFINLSLTKGDEDGTTN